MWRFNAWHLMDQECAHFVEEELQAFLKIHCSSVLSAGALWTVSKPALRGISEGICTEEGVRTTDTMMALEAPVVALEAQTYGRDPGDAE
ncbi:hypothetical protein NDU88_007077 [Pleurodeles waltl]|uniref:Uncharacterized protein n=1 Tax=Pleurodeles waltl TaxID=8319 RepID=A0AAV7NS13_PLEWA|nr:hypothetical protein NDU88_007077 [Pleurodeles waltl]